MTAATIFDIERVREGAIGILDREQRPMSTGEIAGHLSEPLHRVILALDVPLERGQVRRTVTGEWVIATASHHHTERSAEGQERLIS